MDDALAAAAAPITPKPKAPTADWKVFTRLLSQLQSGGSMDIRYRAYVELSTKHKEAFKKAAEG